jgi:hypothetical protein
MISQASKIETWASGCKGKAVGNYLQDFENK